MTRKQKLSFIIMLVLIWLSSLSGCQSKQEYEIGKLYIEGNIEDMTDKSDARCVAVSFDSESVSFDGYAELKLQGSSSLAYDKKNYTIKLYEDENLDDKLKIDFGWGEQNKYCLKANWIDKTHSRNIVTARLVSQIQNKYDVLTDTPCNGEIDGFPIEIYVNDKFHGVYTCNIPKDKWTFGMDDDNPNHIVIGGEDYVPACMFRAEPNFTDWELEVGEENETTLMTVQRLFDFVMNSSDAEFKEEFEHYINKDAMLNYYVMTEFAYLRDNRVKNMILATYDGEVWYPVLYDLDTSWGTHWKGTEVWDYDTELVNMSESYLLERVEQCFGDELSARYFELREDILTKEHIMEEFEKFEETIPAASREKEVERWGDDIPGYDISQIEEYLDAMIDDWDQRYELLGEK